jgi:hypothetical protein
MQQSFQTVVVFVLECRLVRLEWTHEKQHVNNSCLPRSCGFLDNTTYGVWKTKIFADTTIFILFGPTNEINTVSQYYLARWNENEMGITWNDVNGVIT